MSRRIHTKHRNATLQQVAQLLLTNSPTLLPSGERLQFIGRILRLAVITRWQILTAYWPDFQTFAHLSSIWRPQWGGSARAIGFVFCMKKTKMAGIQSGEGRIRIDSVVGAQCVNVTDTQPIFVTDRQPCHRSKCRPTHGVGRHKPATAKTKRTSIKLWKPVLSFFMPPEASIDGSRTYNDV